VFIHVAYFDNIYLFLMDDAWKKNKSPMLCPY
jgi:hypothetical protein